MSEKRPNILMIVADQWRGDALGLLGNEHPVMTPHLDQLATEGCHFTSCFADAPICMPQRATFLTGKTGSQLGVTDNFDCRTPVENEESLPRRLSVEKGYQTAAVGKMHVIPDRNRCGFEQVELLPDDYVMFLEEQGWGGHYRGHGVGGNEVYPVPSSVPEHLTQTRWITERGCRFLKTRDTDAPFFLQMIYETPHSPFDPPMEYYQLYEGMPIPPPLDAPWEGGLPASLDRRRSAYRYDLLRPEIIRKSRQAYYAQLTYIDYQIGRILGELKTRGLYGETCIIFTSDHGEHLGDYGLFGKGSFFHGSAHVPLIIKPAKEQDIHGTSLRTDPVMTADLCPTVLESAGLTPLNEAFGRSLLGNGGQDENRIVFGEYGEESAFAADKQFKYVYFVEEGREFLFDRRTDSLDQNDLSGKTEYDAERLRLRKTLYNYLKGFGRSLAGSEDLISTDKKEENSRAVNGCAWRGPMHYGQGYGGGW